MRSNTAPTRQDTRTAIRRVAEEMFAESGIDAFTTRALAERAGVNMAAVNYHYGNKENLTLEVFRDVCRQTVTRRLALLDALERADPGPPIRAVVDAFLDAYINDDEPRTGILLAHFVLKHRIEPNDWTRAIVAEELDGLALRFIAAIGAACPHLSVRECHWRYHFMVGTILIMISDDTHTGGRIARLSDGLCAPGDRAEFRAEMLNFLCAAFGEEGGPG